MKLRKAWVALDAHGVRWVGDCPLWAQAWREASATVTPARVLGDSRWNCTPCRLGMRH